MKDFRVTIHEGTKRHEEFMKVFGRAEVVVMSFIPELANLPGFVGPQAVYKLDIAELTPEERRKLVEHIAGKFGMPTAEVDNLLDQLGVPILATDCTVTVLNPQRWID